MLSKYSRAIFVFISLKSLCMSIISILRINVAPLTILSPDDPDTPFVRLMSQIWIPD